jgi:hypothetical protein
MWQMRCHHQLLFLVVQLLLKMVSTNCLCLPAAAAAAEVLLVAPERSE